MTHSDLGPGREFDAIREMLRRYGDFAQGVGDDCALLPLGNGEWLCVSTDGTVEDVHFRRGWLAPEELGYRAAMAALSDLAAVAAEPFGMLVAMSVPESWWGKLPGIASGIAEAARMTRTPVVGGDTTRGAALAITITVLGRSRSPLRRGGARAGDYVYVTGSLGGPLTALRDLERGEKTVRHRTRFAHPVARVRPALWLARQGASAAVDVSDGLAADLAHIAAASGVRIRLDLDRVPTVPGISPTEAAASGEEYELAVTAPAPLDVERFRREAALPLTEIGRVLEGGEPGVEAWRGGARVDLPRGHDHFST